MAIRCFRYPRLAALVIIACLFLWGCRESKNYSGGNTKKETPSFIQNESGQKSDGNNGGIDNKPEPDPGKEETKPSPNLVNDRYDNTKYAWYLIKRNDHLPPATGEKLVELADKYNAIYLGDTSRKVVYLTFDEGYENGYTAVILDILKENSVRAAFFITMPYLQKNPDLVERMIREGHIVGNHTVNHPSLPDVRDDQKLKNEIEELSKAYKEKTGQEQSLRVMRERSGTLSETSRLKVIPLEPSMRLDNTESR
ncbi:polysaccharide deacetylase family protein [Thermacetogenium phaeum]|uniref:polysaccharide deacetylase family protein n=1 Tax=Thermacetogenium phaeum TaxID=85874 RepID=UPI000677CF22|nr:polysaccharide deacetylase family protein [Thermacetogenium phaeum]